MSRKTYNKLIRDKVPEIIKMNGGNPKISILDNGKFRTALKEKLVEEAKELLDAKTIEENLDELADVLQLLGSIALNNNKTVVEVEKRKEKKKIEQGENQNPTLDTLKKNYRWHLELVLMI